MNAPLPPSSPADPGTHTDVTMPPASVVKRVLGTMRLWVDSHSSLQSEADAQQPPKADWLRLIPFIGIHLACFTVIWVGWSWTAVWVAVALYAVRMFTITGFYHRYLSHRSYSTSRFLQFVLACIGNSSVQRGPLWWAAHHRHHHRYSDMPEDHHSPRQSGFIWAHMGWISSKSIFRTNLKLVPDLAKFPELMFLDRFDTLLPALLGTSCFFLGYFLNVFYPDLGTSGLQMLVWGFCISTVAVAHGTFCVNSLTHIIGTQPYPSKDDSRNSFLVALITLGEGWHNNHHYYQSSVRQGFHWWQIDMTWYVLWMMSKVGLVWGLKPVPDKVRYPNRADAGPADESSEPASVIEPQPQQA